MWARSLPNTESLNTTTSIILATGSWNTFSMTLETVASGEIQVQDSLITTKCQAKGIFTSVMPMLAQCFQKLYHHEHGESYRSKRRLRLNTAGIQLPPGFSIRKLSGQRSHLGRKTTFTVSVDTSVAGPRWGTFSFATSDSDENPSCSILPQMC